jgi:hypothetical protein
MLARVVALKRMPVNVRIPTIADSNPIERGQ